MNENFSWLRLIFFSLSLSPSLYFSLSYALIFLYLSVKRRKKRRDLCLCMCVINDDHGWDLQARVYIHRCLTHANYRASNKNRERERKDEWWQDRNEMPSIFSLYLTLVFSDDDVACRILSMSTIFVSFLSTMIRSIYIDQLSIDSNR